jgi:hypothetical protein
MCRYARTVLTEKNFSKKLILGGFFLEALEIIENGKDYEILDPNL